MRPSSRRMALPLCAALLTVPALVRAEDKSDNGYHPWVHYPRVQTVDLSEEARAHTNLIAEPVVQPDFWSLDELQGSPEQQEAEPDPTLAGELPEGWVQQGNVVVPKDVALGLKEPDIGPIFAVEDIPGNKYPRKHTLFLNFGGADLKSGTDNSAENTSTLAKQGPYPPFGGGETVALSIIQAVQNDLEAFGVRVVYDVRPPKVVPYTMEMVGGNWTDTNLDSPAGGVAPGADCGALGQRHVVYTFSNGASVLGAANTASQEAGHAWGLDHTFNCSSVMSYCGGGDGSYQTQCDGLCESQCQGSAGCRLTHEMFCGVGNDQQNDAAELEWIFGGNEPDMEPPTVEIVEPEDGLEVEAGANVNLRAIVDDNYGGFGWQFTVEKDGEVIYDAPDYERDVDPEYRAALNFTNLEAGVYVLTVTAQDHYEQVTTDSVTLYVGGAQGGDSGGSADSTGGDSGEGGEDSGAAEGGTGGADDGGGDDGSDDGAGEGGGAAGEDSGCACHASGSGPGALPLMLGLGLWWMRRRPAQA